MKILINLAFIIAAIGMAIALLCSFLFVLILVLLRLPYWQMTIYASIGIIIAIGSSKIAEYLEDENNIY